MEIAIILTKRGNHDQCLHYSFSMNCRNCSCCRRDIIIGPFAALVEVTTFVPGHVPTCITIDLLDIHIIIAVTLVVYHYDKGIIHGHCPVSVIGNLNKIDIVVSCCCYWCLCCHHVPTLFTVCHQALPRTCQPWSVISHILGLQGPWP